MNAIWKYCKGFLFQFFPHHFLSRITFWVTRLQTPLKNPAIRAFIRTFNIDMTEACYPDPEDYASFNEFFTRRLIPGARPIASGADVIVSPADGYISQFSSYAGQRAIQAKGRWFSMHQLLGGANEYGCLCERGKFVTVYLSPRNYHRVHMPLDGTLLEMIHVPGRLFSVAPYAGEVLNNLYARNERIVSIFKTGTGYMAVVMVGAVNVAAIEMTWHGLVTPPRGKTIYRKKYSGIDLKKGEELGVFNMGSTAIVAFDSHAIEWYPDLRSQQPVKMGQLLGTTTRSLNPDTPALP
ncbi:MAG: archaetidylserine decarboxylase [Gammaproteobacteria bacterium]|nr:archaetidylserine decarboxylase [Gammaproteobacteria bacterium]